MTIDKIICVGKNYLEHALELGDPVPEKPVIFLKPPSVLRQARQWNETIFAKFPHDDSCVQPECEIVFSLATGGFNLTKKEVLNAIASVTLGLDMTLRTRQTLLKKQGHPWTTSKVFPDSAMIGPWIPYHDFSDYLTQIFELTIDNELRQQGKGLDMMMYPLDLLVYISQFFPLKAGDIVYTGTPVGVSAIKKGTVAKLKWASYEYSVKWE